MVFCFLSFAEAKAEKTDKSGVRWTIEQKEVDGDLIREELTGLIGQEDRRREIFMRAGMDSFSPNEKFFKVFFENDKAEMSFCIDGLTYQFRTRVFEGFGGPAIPSDDGFGHREYREYGMCRGILKFIDESYPGQLTLTGICDDFCDYRLSLKCNGNFIDFELEIENRMLDEKTYWFDNCFMFPRELFNPQSELYYFNPDPVFIEHVAEPDRHRFSIMCRKEVLPFWEEIKPAGNKNPQSVLLVYNRNQDLGIVIAWENAAMLGVNFYSCVHVNPSFSFGKDVKKKKQILRGKIGVLQGDLSSMHSYIIKNCY